jgi:hypothetical protein
VTLVPPTFRPLPNPSAFLATPQTDHIDMTWRNPIDPRFEKVRIIRSDISFPKDQFDGLPIYEGSGTSFRDRDVVEGRTYHYTIFATDGNGLFSSGAVAQAIILTAEGVIGKPRSSDPFLDVPQALVVDPMIAGLTLTDFDFYQDGKLLLNLPGNPIQIDGGKDLTIKLVYGKVPEILKTIAFSVADPGDQSKIFTFLLRVDADRNAYEATLGAFEMAGTLGMSIVILDYQNQGLKRIHGDLQASLYVSPAFLHSSFDPLGLLLLLLLILIVIFFMLWSNRLDRSEQKRAEMNPVRAYLS